MFFGKYLKLKLHSCRIFLNLGVKSKSPKVEKVSVTVCKTLKLLQNIRNVMETAGKILENLVFVVLSLRYKLTELFHPFEKHIYHLG